MDTVVSVILSLTAVGTEITLYNTGYATGAYRLDFSVERFTPPNQARTFYAENDIDESEEDPSVLKQHARRQVDAHWH